MNRPAIVVSLVIALAVSLFNGVYPFSFKLFFGIFAVWAIGSHHKPGLFGKLKKPKEDEPTDNDSDK